MYEIVWSFSVRYGNSAPNQKIFFISGVSINNSEPDNTTYSQLTLTSKENNIARGAIMLSLKANDTLELQGKPMSTETDLFFPFDFLYGQITVKKLQ